MPGKERFAVQHAIPVSPIFKARAATGGNLGTVGTDDFQPGVQVSESTGAFGLILDFKKAAYSVVDRVV